MLHLAGQGKSAHLVRDTESFTANGNKAALGESAGKVKFRLCRKVMNELELRAAQTVWPVTLISRETKWIGGGFHITWICIGRAAPGNFG